MKTCSKCKKTKTLEEFRINKNCKQGRTPSCRICINEYERERYKRPDVRKAQIKKGYNYHRTIEGKNAYYLRNYKITYDQYLKLLKDQDGKCAGCLNLGSDDSPLVVDHDHNCCPEKSRSCGKCVRGLLCQSCNSTLGRIKDNPDTLRRLADYLSGLSLSSEVQYN